MTGRIVEIGQICRQVAPDLAGLGCYPVLASEAGIPVSESCGGLTTRNLDLILRPAIGGRWIGRGPCWLLLDAPEVDGWQLLETSLHELAHCLSFIADYRNPTPVDPVMIAWHRQLLPKVAAVDVHAPEYQTASQVWIDFLHHPPEFIRIALHLHYRTWELGTELCRPDVVGRREGQSDGNRYHRALGDECERLAHLSIAEILKIPAPPAFTDLAIHDLKTVTLLVQKLQREEQAMSKGTFESVKEFISGWAQTRQQTRARTISEVSRMMADGKRPDDETLEAALAESHMEPDEFLRAIETEAERLRQCDVERAAVQAGTEAEACLPEINAQITAVADRLKQAQAEHDQAMAPLMQRYHAMQNLISQKFDAERRLMDLATPDLKAQLANVGRRRNQCTKESHALRERLDQLKEAAKGERQRANETESRNFRTDYLERAKHADAAAAECVAKLAQIEQQTQDLATEEQVILAAMHGEAA